MKPLGQNNKHATVEAMQPHRVHILFLANIAVLICIGPLQHLCDLLDHYITDLVDLFKVLVTFIRRFHAHYFQEKISPNLQQA